MLTQQRDCFQADDDRQRAGAAHAKLAERQHVDVGRRSVEVRHRLIKVRIIHRTEAFHRRRLKQVFRSDIVLGEDRRRQVAAPHAQILRQVAQDVDQLQRLAEAHGVLEQLSLLGGVHLEQMPQRDVRPEFTDTAGHAIGVVVEFLLPRERDDRAGVGVSKSLQIQRLSADDDVEHTSDVLLVRRGKLLEIGHRCGGIFQQLGLVRILL